MNDISEKRVPAIERASMVLDLVAKRAPYPSLSQIAKELKLAKSSVHSICSTLVQLKLLVRRADQTYQLGPHVMRWSNAFSRQSDVATEFSAIWDQESEMPGATITLSVLEGAEVVYIAARNSADSHPLVDFRTGMRLPAAFTATGKAFLSYMRDSEVKRLFEDGLPEPRTRHSVQDIDTLLEELKATRMRKYSIDNQQVADGIVCFGAPVLDSKNKPIAGIAVSLLVDDLDEEVQEKTISNVLRIASTLSERMGAEL